jgi:dimethylargininase
MRRAFTRAVSPRLAECELTHLERQPISAETAVAQHARYEQAIAEAGFDIVRLPSLDGHPDGVFVEDTAILLGNHAVITRLGAPSRAAETGSTAAGLSDHFELHRIEDGVWQRRPRLISGRRSSSGVGTETDRFDSRAGGMALALNRLHPARAVTQAPILFIFTPLLSD